MSTLLVLENIAQQWMRVVVGEKYQNMLVDEDIVRRGSWKTIFPPWQVHKNVSNSETVLV